MHPKFEENHHLIDPSLFSMSQSGEEDVIPETTVTVNNTVSLSSSLLSLLKLKPVRSQAALDKILATFKTDAPFFETQSLTYPDELDVPDASDDLKRELEL
jgi:hypothetical protein